MMKQLIARLHSEGCSCVIAKGDETRIFRQRGVADLYDLNCQCPDFLQGALVADKVVGKAAAALMIRGGIKELYADTLSRPALSLLEAHHIRTEYEYLVPHIENRAGTGWCPMERLCYEENSIERMFTLIEKFVRNMRSTNGSNTPKP